VKENTERHEPDVRTVPTWIQFRHPPQYGEISSGDIPI